MPESGLDVVYDDGGAEASEAAQGPGTTHARAILLAILSFYVRMYESV